LKKSRAAGKGRWSVAAKARMTKGFSDQPLLSVRSGSTQS